MEPYILERSEHPISRRHIDPNVMKVLYRLLNAGHVAYLVGGGVRDLMLGRRPKDFDVGTSAHPHEVRTLFRNSRLIGRRFRLAHVFFGPQNIEVATFRRSAEEVPPAEGELLVRHDNTFGTPEEDALRRDFTVNALFYDPRTFRVIDYVGGLADLGARLIRTVGEPDLRMREDPVRMLRAVRFAAKLGFEIEPATRAAIERHRVELLKASTPRLVEEIYRTLGSTGARRALVLMEQLGLLEVVLPRLSHHLRSDPAAPEETATARNLAALERAVEGGLAGSHGLILACLFLDLFLRLQAARPHPGAERIDLMRELRAQGFARGDTERMRLLLEAFPRLLRPTRRTRALIHRPYFGEARILYQLAAVNYTDDTGALERFLSDQERFLAREAAERGVSAAAAAAGERRHAPARRRRRRRRRGRHGRPGLPLHQPAAASAPRAADGRLPGAGADPQDAGANPGVAASAPPRAE